MKETKKMLQSSLHELKSTKNIVLCGLLAALAVILSMVANISIGPYIKIGFAGLPNRIVESLFGPVVGCFFGSALDLLKYLLKPDGPFFFGFTLNAMLAGILYGCLLYRKPVRFRRIFFTEFLCKLFINCGLNTLWISMLYGKAFYLLLPMRLIKNAIMLPIDSFILFFTLTYVKKLVAQLGFSASEPAIPLKQQH